MNYYVERKNSDHLAHRGYGSGNFSFGTGSFAGPALKAAKAGKSTVRRKDWSNHKYITKISIGGRVRYIYNQAQLAAAKAGKFAAKTATNAGKFAAKTAARAGRAIDNKVGWSARRRVQRVDDRKDLEYAGYKINRENTRKDGFLRDAKRIHNSQRRHREFVKQSRRAHNIYDKTLLGRLEKAGSKARSMVDNASRAAKRAGENFTGSIKKEAYKVPGRIKSARRTVSKAIDTHITGASAKRAANAESNRWKTQNSKSGPGSRSRANRAKANAKAYEKKYRNSLAGRLDSLGDWADSQRKKAIKKKNK